MKNLIAVEEAIALVIENVETTTETELISLDRAIGHVLAENLYAPISLPPFPQSAMDGYALNYHDSNKFLVIGEVKAGDATRHILSKGQAVRIFTGAEVPKSANAVIKQELISKEGQSISVEGTIVLGSNIRQEGEQIQKNSLALNKGVTLNASTIGFIAALGLVEIPVYKKPSVVIIVTGNELVPGGQDLKDGQIYESNAVMLKNALRSLGILSVDVLEVKDDYQQTELVLNNALQHYDFTLVSGGISVGDYDFVGSALDKLGVDQIFYKVKQKPGQPLYFGRRDHNFVFALPGNPASTLSCFYMGKANSTTKKVRLTAKNSYTKTGSRAYFLKAYAETEFVEILDGQASSMLRSFAVANALVYLPEEVYTIDAGALVETLLLPN
jgi:molybdopterin molybdotransferase